MKLFKRIYYPIMAALVVLMLVLGIVDAHAPASKGKLKTGDVNAAFAHAEEIMAAGESGTHNSLTAASQDSVRSYIVNTLKNAGVAEVDSDILDDDGNNTALYATVDDVAVPTLTVQKATVRQSSQEGNAIAVSREVRNVIVAVPGTSDKAILLFARYDTAAIGGGADASAAGSLLAEALRVVNGAKTTNTVAIVFGDAGQENDLGARAFLHQFAGFDGLTDKIEAVADFRPEGTGGTLMVYGKSNGDLTLVGKYAKFNGGNYMSSAVETLLSHSDSKSGSDVFGDYNTLAFTNRGGFDAYGTARDSSVNKKLVRQHFAAMDKFVGAFANASLAKMDAKQSAVYFSYLDVMTVYYPVAVSFVIGGILLGLIIAIIILNVRNKAFSLKNILLGAAVQLLTLAATSLSLLAFYYLFALLLSGFGSVPFHGISSVRYAGTGMLLSAVALATALAIFFYIVLKRTFGVKATDVVRGNALVWGLAAIVLSFALPKLSYPFTCVALFALTVLLLTVIFKAKFKARFNTDIERLFLYVWPIVIALPLIMPVIYAAQTLFSAVTIVLILAVFIGLAGFIAPYADYLKPVIDRVFKKLPPRTIRVEREVTEQVEDRAKKGKFTTVTSKKVIKEKTPWNYLNRIGVSAVAILSSFMIILFCAFNATFSTSAVARVSYADSIYDDALLFVYEKNGSSAATANVAVYDQAAYNYIRYAINDMHWNGDARAYQKEYAGRVEDIIPQAPDFEKSGDIVSFTPFDAAHSQTTVTLKNASGVTSVTFNPDDDEDTGRKSEEYTFLNQDTITFTLPYGYEAFTMEIDASCEIEFTQHVYNVTNLESVGEDWKKMYDYYLSNKDVGPALRSGIVIKVTKTV
ncbi:MAG: hypothetical protein K2M95_06220 [Clostridiales bacterium]|nr:hypothetical protein [Clostridiales bacterium]